MPTDVFEVSGDADLAWMHCRDQDDIGPLEAALHDGIPLAVRRAIPLAHGESLPPARAVLAACVELSVGPLLLADSATAALLPLLSPAGYFIETELDAEQRYRIFVCERELDALDQQRSEFDRLPSGSIWHVFRYEFQEEKLEGEHVFKLRDLRGSLFVSDRFVSLADAHRLRGFKFKHVWNRRTGGVPLNPHERKYESYPGETDARAEAKRQAMRETLAKDRAVRLEP